jgi:putative addiction module killer protein
MELKLDFGPGYRIYFGIVEEAGVLPLVGGDKHCPRRDIKRAQDFWNEYLTGVSND